jgi:polyhydroxybutyrate depolymerase
MAYTLACAIPARLAGIASVSGGMPVDIGKASMRCSDGPQSKPVSIMEMHGTADDFVPYAGGGVLQAPPIVDVARYWAMVDGCSGDAVMSQSGITTTSLWKQCSGATVVRLDTVTGGHNAWFGSGANAVPGEPNASAVVWDFFKGLRPVA